MIMIWIIKLSFVIIFSTYWIFFLMVIAEAYR